MTTEAERRELAAFLRSRRRRRSPADAGLVTGRRRSPGLRREDVAALAGVSVTWDSWLEQARDINPSEQVLGSLARALALDEAETAHLFRLAGHRPPIREQRGGADLSAAYRMLLDQLDPCPAMVTNHRFDVLAWNRGHTAMFGDFARYEGDRRNMLWYTFLEPEARRLVVDWAEQAAFVVGLFRSQASELLATEPFTRLVRTLAAESAEFAELWERRDLVSFTPTAQALQHPTAGRIELHPVKLYAVQQDRTVVAYLAEPGSPTHRRLTEAIG